MKVHVRSLVLSILLLSVLQFLKGQNAYLDARKIIDIQAKYASQWEAIQQGQFPLGLQEAEKQLLREIVLFTQHPFGSEVSNLRLIQTKSYQTLAAEQIIMDVPGTASAFSAIGKPLDAPSSIRLFHQSLDKGKIATQAIQATTQLIAKRTRDELTAVFFAQFHHKIKSNSYLQTFFPTTNKLLGLQSGYATPALGSNWTTIFETDLQAIPFQVETLVAAKNPDFSGKLEGRLLSAALVSARLFKEKAAALGVLGYLNETMSKIPGNGAQEISKSLRFSAMLANNLRGVSREQSTVTADSLEALGAEGKVYFWGLLYQRHRSVFSEMGFTPSVENLSQVHPIAEGMSILLSRFKKQEGSELDWVSAARNMMDIVEMGFKAPFQALGNANEYYNSVIYLEKMAIPRNILTVLQLTRDGQYGLAVLGAFEVLQSCLPVVQTDDKERAYFDKVTYYANFLSDVVTAGSSGEVAQIMERYVMPSGSYRIKRSVPFSLDINAYPGLFAGAEFLKGSFPVTRDEISVVNGITTPIGLAVSTRLGKKEEPSGHGISLFIPVIDVGGAFSYRWSKNSSGGLPEKFKLSQVFAPGAYLAWNIKNAPASLLVGVQHTPALRSLRNINNETTQEGTLRFGMSISMDLPVFNLLR